MSKLDLIATCAFGLEAVVRRELEQLGYTGRVVSPGRIHFEGDPLAICRANLWLRCADRVLIQLGRFEAKDFGQLFDETKALHWDEWIGPHDAFPVKGKSIKSQLSSVPACQRMVKKAIVESLRASHEVNELDESGVRYTVEIALLADEATLTIDTTGPGLNKRGYRTLVGEAPLKETLAAAMILLSFWNRERPMIDPFCGSGTIPIEAAMIGRNLAPGLHRDFAFHDWPTIASNIWSESTQEARDLALPDLVQRIIANDRDEGALSLARYHVNRAGVEGDIHFQQKEFSQLTSKREYGCLITNPPYGQRIGDDRGVEELYRIMPLVLRRLPTWSHFILTSYPRFEQVVDREADRRRKLFNARIECTYYQFHGPRPDAGRPDAGHTVNESNGVDEMPEVRSDAPVFGGVTDKGREQSELFRNRLLKRAKHLRRWPARRGITCFRLYERDIPEIPLVVDRYEDCLHIAEYERPHDRPVGAHADWLDLLAKTAAKTLDVDRDKVFFKQRLRQRGTTQHEKYSDEGREITVHEGGLKFLVNLADYVDTGLFLDHRITRSMVRDQAKGARMLNLFAYTGSFSVYAADGGAAGTVTVDMSKNYLSWARRNMELNGFYPPQHEFFLSDAFEYLHERAKDDAFDLAVVDPPTFSNSKRTEEDWDVQRDHVKLLRMLIPKVRPGGTIYFSTNFRRFRLDEESLAGVQIREISKSTVPEDFRNKRIHRCWKMERSR